MKYQLRRLAIPDFFSVAQYYPAELSRTIIGSIFILVFTSQQAIAADPIAHDDQFSTSSGQQVSGLLSSNDEFLDGPTDNYAILANAANGMASVSTDGSFSYTPNIGFAGTDTFRYSIDDGAGGTSSALVNISVAAASNFLSSASPILFAPEDTQVPLGLSVAQDLFDGGALQDLIATDALFRSDSAGATPVLSSIPTGTSGVTITGYSTQSLNTSGDDLIDDDYQLLNVRIDLVSGTSSGRVAFINHGRLANLDQYSWEDVPLGQAVLNDPLKVTGFYASGDSNPTFSVVAGSLQIVETHTLETAYIVEYLTSDGDSTNFLGAGNTVQVAGESSSTLSFPAALEPAATKHGIIALNATSAAAGSNFQVEHKGFARLLIDLNTQSVSGSIAAQRGENVNNTVTYSFENYPLIDKRISSATPVSILASSASIVGDTTADASVVQDPTLYINSSGQLTIERASGFAAVFTSIYTAEYYERTGFSSIASTVSIGSADALFDSSPADGVDEFGEPVNEFVFSVPASAHVGLLQMSWNTIGGNDTNENIGLGFAVVDLESGVSSGSMTFIRASTPDLLSWDGVPFGSTFFGTSNGNGDPLYQSNKTAGSFTDPFVQTAKFLLTSNPDGSRSLTFTATSTGGTQNFRDYRGNANISWLGNEPFSISGVPTQGLLSHGSPNDAGGWEIDFSDIPALAYQPAPHESGTIPLSFGLSSTGETENIELRIAPIADSPSLSSTDVVGFIDNTIDINIVVADSADTDGSETHPTSVTFENVPSSVTLSATTGTVSNLGTGTWLVDRASLPTLTANASSTLDTTISVSVLQIDEKDVDGDLVIEDNSNGNGVDEFDELQVSDSFSLRVQSLPTVTRLLVNNGVPVISGTASSAAGGTLTVTVNNIVYPQSGPDLIVNGDGTWTLTIPAANTLAENTYTVTAQITHSSGNLGSDTTDDELVVDLTPPPVPGVTSQTTMDSTPTIRGTLAVASGNTLGVSVNGVPYTEGDGQLVDNGDGTWELQVPAINFLPDALYQIIATLTDAAGNTSTDASVDELLIDTLAPPSPGVTSQTSNDITPVIEGTAVLVTGDILTVEVNNILYTVGDGNLVDIGDGTWTLSIPVANVLSEAVYDVSATVTDAALNVATDPSSNELTIDLTAPASPTVTAQLTNQTTPTLMGTASVGGGETLSVSVNGMVYAEGDGNLINNGDSTWTLTIPTNNALSEGIFEVTATVMDAAGNSSSDSSSTELEVDLTTPPIPTVVSQLTASATPTITGTATIAAGDTLSVDVNGVVYLTGTGDLLDNGNDTWSLAIPTGNALLDGSYEVLVSISDAAGNVALDVSSTELVVDLTPPPAPGVTSQTTSDSTPLISGITSIMSGSTLRVEVNNVVYVAGDGNLVDNLDGTWDLTIPIGNTLSDAVYQIIATLTDAAGNISTDAGIDELLVDTMAPPSPGVTSLTTNDTTPLIMGTATVVAGETLTVMLNTEIYTAGDGHLTDNNDGTWTLIVPSGNSLLDGAYDVTATVTDAALNTSTDPSSSELLIDTLAPASPTVTSQVTNTTTPTITGTATVSVGESLLVTVNGISYTVGDGALLDNADGTWTLVIPVGDELPEALFDVSVTVTDGAGNSASDVSINELDIDLTPPAVPTVTSLLTNNVSPTLIGTASLTPGDVLSVSVNSQIYVVGDGALSTSGENWTLIIPNANSLIEATWDVLATISDAAGNISSDNSTSELIIDLTPPPAPGVTSQTTNDDTPLIEGTTTIGSGMTLRVEVDGELYVEGDGNLVNNGDGTWALTIPMVNALGDALYQVIASLTDAAGNVSTETGIDELLVDTMAPTSPGVTSQTINTGTPVIAGTATVGANETLTVTVNSVTYTTSDGNLVDNTDGTWTLTIPASNALAEASYDVTAIVTDVALNTSTDPSSSELTIDLTAPAAPTINAQLTNSTTPTLSGTATVAVGETLSVMVNGVTYVAGDGNLVDNGDGTWTLVVPTGSALPEGLLSVSAIVTDAAGNSAISASIDDLQIDLTPPVIPTVNVQLTNSETPTLSGTATVATGETLSVTVNSVPYVAGDGNLVDNGNGTWTLVIPTGNELPEASIDVLVSILDAAGNSSSDISTNELTVDLTPPPAPGVTSQTTNDDTPLIEGTTTIGSGMTLRVEVDGELYVEGDGNLVNNGDGTWALTIPMVNALSDALYHVIASLSDAAGNVSTETGIDELLVDTMAPTSPGVTSQTINTGTPVISGTAIVGNNEILTVIVNSVTYTAGDGNLVDHTDGTWTLTIPASNTLAEASYGVTATVTDVALNTSTDPSSSELTIDITAPVAPTVNALETNVTTPIVSGSATVQTGETLRVTVNGVPYVANDGHLVDNIDGTWSLSIPATAALTEADYDVLVTVTDAAGNSTLDASIDELKIDLTAASAPMVSITSDVDNNGMLSLAEPADPVEVVVSLPAGANVGDSVLISNGSSPTTMILTSANLVAGNITISYARPSEGASLTVVATHTDQAGNSSAVGTDNAVVDTIPTLAPIVSIIEDTDNNALIGSSELAGNINVRIFLPNGVSAGDTLLFTIDGSDVAFVLGPVNIAAGIVNIVSAVSSDGDTVNVTASITDSAGNASLSANDSAVLDFTPPPLPTVNTLISNTGTPTLSGFASLSTDYTLTVALNGQVYTDGDGSLVINSNGSWTLSVQSIAALIDGVYEVITTLTDLAGNTTTDSTTNELTIDLTAPVVPTVNAQLTNSATPTLSGTATVATGEMLSVTVNGVSYVAGDGNLVDNGDGTWTLVIPAGNELPQGVIDVSVIVTDAAGNSSTNVNTGELEIDLTPPVVPTFNTQLTNSPTPSLSGTATVSSGETLSVTVNGVTYIAGDSHLVDNGDGTWTLDIPSGNALPEGSIAVTTTVSDAAGNISSDNSTSELIIDLTPPPAPGVTSQTTNDDTPLIEGTTTIGSGMTLRVEVDGELYVEGDGNLVNNGDGTWALTIPMVNALSDALYQVIASLSDAAGNVSTETGIDELLVDTMAPTSPGVTSQTINTGTPVIAGTATVGANETLTVTVNSVIYTAGDGNLVDHTDGTWTLTIPASNTLAEASYDVIAIVTDVAMNTSTDPSSSELTIDLTAPAAPTVNAHLTNSTTPTLSGTATVAVGESLSVSVNGVTYVAGDGNLVDNGDGTWTLVIPTGNELPQGVIDVSVTVSDAAGNSTSDSVTDDLEIDLTPPVVPTVNAQLTNSPTPTLSGTATLASGETLSVTVNGVIYNSGDGNLVDNGDGTWTLAIPTGNELPQGVIDVSVTVTDTAGNSTSDSINSDLEIDLTPPVTPTVNAQLSNSPTPTLNGTATVAAGGTLSVTVNGITYVAGAGHLVDNGNGTWALLIPTSDALSDGSYTVAVNIQDAAGNTSSAVGQSLHVDTAAPELTATGPQQATTFRPTLSGTAVVANGSLVQVRDAQGGLICDDIVTDNTWSCIPLADFPEGETQLFAYVADSANNVSTANFAISVSRDFDGDGLSNVLEGFGDSDGDGVSDSADLDADNDGLPDRVEGTNDTDNDGLPDYLDEDADNDGIADLVEALGNDVDGDFLVDNFIDADGNGLSDSLQLTPLQKPDTDADGIPDFLDVDSDQDGIPDLVETLGTDVDDNGRVDSFRDLDANGVDDAIQLINALLLDSDGDGTPDYRDLDSDNDGITDLIESGGVDIDNDGIVDTASDTNNNGIPDSVDVFFTNGNDIDQDGIDDLADASITFGDDSDGDGILDDFDPDSDGDGRADSALFDLSLGAAIPDTDLDGTPDFQQAGSGALRTGVTGRGGCSVGSGTGSTSDSSLMLFLFLALIGLVGRSQRLRRQESPQHDEFSDCGNAENAKYAVALLLLLIASTASSDDLHRGPYLGAGIGQSLLEPDASDVVIKLQDRTDTAFSVLFGLDLTPRLGVELGYEDLGQATLSNDVYVDYQIGHASVLVRGFNEQKNLIHRKGFSLFGKVGIGRMENSANFNYIREHDTSLIFGGGAEYGFSNGLALRADLTTFDTDAHRLGIFLLYRPNSGDIDKISTPKTVVKKPVIRQLVVPTDEKDSAASVVADTNSVLPESDHTIEFVILFDLNSSFTDFQGKVTAVNVAARMRHAPTLNVRLTGYTDTSGSDDYNRWLADRRIKQVSTLLHKRGVDPSRISAVVFGESSEFSSENRNDSKHLNRRVQIELFNERR